MLTVIDTIQRYRKLKENASAFTITQFGLSAFKWDSSESKCVWLGRSVVSRCMRSHTSSP